MPEDNIPQPTAVMSGNTFEQLPNQKASKWRYFFIVLGILQTVGLAIFFLYMAWAIQRNEAKADISGLEFIDLIVFITLVPTIGLVALINLVGLPLYLRKHKPQGKWLVFSILSLLVSVILALYGAYNVYLIRVKVPKHLEKSYQQSTQNTPAKNNVTP